MTGMTVAKRLLVGMIKSRPKKSHSKESSKPKVEQPERFYDALEYPASEKRNQRDRGQDQFFDAVEHLPFADANNDADEFFDALEYQR